MIKKNRFALYFKKKNEDSSNNVNALNDVQARKHDPPVRDVDYESVLSRRFI